MGETIKATVVAYSCLGKWLFLLSGVCDAGGRTWIHRDDGYEDV